MIGPIYLRPGTTDGYVFHQIFDEALYKPAMGLRDYRTIIDGGANIGMSALYFCKHFPHAAVLCIEPDAENSELLTKNTREKRGVRIFQCGLGGEFGRADIRDPGIGAFGLQTRYSTTGSLYIYTIDQFVVDSARPTLVKLDIEGAETGCFQHSEGWLKHVDVLAVELHSQEAKDALGVALQFDGRQHRMWTVGETTFIDFSG